MTRNAPLSKRLKLVLIATFPLRVLFTSALILVIAAVIVYLIEEVLDGRAILYPAVALWIFLAYITLPWIHRKLTKVYLPNYFIGRTRTGDGFLGDPINLAFNGTENDIKRAMESSGWVLADELTAQSTLKMIKRTITRRSYPNAPVSSLFLFSNKQSFAYQMEVGGSTAKRHHIRFWKVPKGWYMPGGYKADWLAAATYDRKVGFSSFTFQITHKIGEDIDEERQFVINSLTSTTPIRVEVIENYSSAYHDRNGGGDTIQTDGALPFITL